MAARKFDSPARRLAARSRITRGLLRGETIEEISKALEITVVTTHALIYGLTRDWAAQELNLVDSWKRRLLAELEDLKQELYQRYAGAYDQESGTPGEGRIVQSTVSETTGTKPGVVETVVRRPVGLELAALQEIRAIIADQRKILGLDAPLQVRTVQLDISVEELKSLTNEQLDDVIKSLGVDDTSKSLPDSEQRS